MVYLVHQWWPGRPATKRRGQTFLKLSIDDGYRLHFLVPGGHIGSRILHVKHHAAQGTKNEDYISSGIRDMTIFRNPTWLAYLLSLLASQDT